MWLTRQLENPPEDVEDFLSLWIVKRWRFWEGVLIIKGKLWGVDKLIGLLNDYQITFYTLVLINMLYMLLCILYKLMMSLSQTPILYSTWRTIILDYYQRLPNMSFSYFLKIKTCTLSALFPCVQFVEWITLSVILSRNLFLDVCIQKNIVQKYRFIRHKSWLPHTLP